MSSGQIQGGDGRFQVSGELGFATVNVLLEESASILFAAPVSQLDLDLGGVSRADSAGLALLLQWLRMARERGVTVRYHHLPPQLHAIARAGELENLLPLAE